MKQKSRNIRNIRESLLFVLISVVIVSAISYIAFQMDLGCTLGTLGTFKVQ